MWHFYDIIFYFDRYELNILWAYTKQTDRYFTNTSDCWPLTELVNRTKNRDKIGNLIAQFGCTLASPNFNQDLI